MFIDVFDLYYILLEHSTLENKRFVSCELILWLIQNLKKMKKNRRTWKHSSYCKIALVESECWMCLVEYLKKICSVVHFNSKKPLKFTSSRSMASILNYFLKTEHKGKIKP